MFRWEHWLQQETLPGVLSARDEAGRDEKPIITFSRFSSLHIAVSDSCFGLSYQNTTVLVRKYLRRDTLYATVRVIQYVGTNLTLVTTV